MDSTIAKQRPLWKKIVLALLVVFGCFLAYRILSVYRFRSVACEPPKNAAVAASGAPPERFVVLNFNTEGHATLWERDHLEEIAAVIRDQRADIVGLQEVHRGTWQARFDDQAEALARLTGMKVVFGPSFRTLGGEFGNAILTRGEIEESDVTRLPGVGEPRSLLRARIRLDGRVVDFYVTHLAAWGWMFRESRKNQVDCIRRALERSSVPAIAVGDFNATPDKEEMLPLMNHPRFTELGIKEEPTHKVMQQHIDYVIGDRRFRRLIGGRVEVDPSDHYPIRLELVWNGADER